MSSLGNIYYGLVGWFKAAMGYLAPLFLVLSPVISYSDQAISMQRNKSSAGFSLDIPLIMLVASILRIFYYPGARFDKNLLIQSIIMIGMQLLLLKIALDHRPPSSARGGDAATPFSSTQETNIFTRRRPYTFWQWRSPKPYWQFLLYLFIALTVGELIIGSIQPLYDLYSPMIGIIGLTVEATLPLPQIMVNETSRSCKGFRLSVLITWLAGDAMKMSWFFTAETEIPLAFKVCGIFQACCDCFLGIQYLRFGDGSSGAVKEHPLEDYPAGAPRPSVVRMSSADFGSVAERRAP